MSNTFAIINHKNEDEKIDNFIENLVIHSYVDISKLNFPNSIKYIKLVLLKEPLLNLPFSLEKITIDKGCKCCLEKSKIPFGCEIDLIQEEAHDYQDKTFVYARNYNILRIMSGMSGLSYAN
jgi:hypothetical protein